MEGDRITKDKHPEIYEWLSENVLYYKEDQKYYTLTSDKKINVRDSVVLKQHVTEIKYSFGYINGYFECRLCDSLTSLINSPEKVGGCFDCGGSKNLTSLIGSPKEVGGSFMCNGCEKLTSLIGAPQKIGEDFSCSFCYKLTSFIGFPKHIGGSIYHVDNVFLNNPKEEMQYNKYIDMWVELLESVSEDDKWEYINNYKDRIVYSYKQPIIPKEVMNKYKIEFLLK